MKLASFISLLVISLITGMSFDLIDSQEIIAINSIDTANEKLIPELNIKTIKVGQTIKINKLIFEADSYQYNESSTEALYEILVFLNQNPSVRIELGGHTNSIPPSSYCDDLSSKRAKSVMQFFLDEGIMEERLVSVGYGKRQPISNNLDATGRENNQRVEIKILHI